MECPKHWIAKKMPVRHYEVWLLFSAGYHFGTFSIYPIKGRPVWLAVAVPDQVPTPSLSLPVTV